MRPTTHGFIRGDKIVFDVANCSKKPYGSGVITTVTEKGFMVSPDYPLAAGVVIENVRKASDDKQ